MDTHMKNVDHYNCMRCYSDLVASWQLNIRWHDHDDEHDYGYVEELYEKLGYISQCIDELKKRLEE